jgi:hypothetical protein
VDPVQRGKFLDVSIIPPPRPSASAGGIADKTARSRLKFGSARRAAPTLGFFYSRSSSGIRGLLPNGRGLPFLQRSLRAPAPLREELVCGKRRIPARALGPLVPPARRAYGSESEPPLGISIRADRG